MENPLHLAIDQHPVCPNRGPAWTLTSEMVPLGRKPWREARRSVQVKIYLVWSHQLTSDLKRCLLFWKCLHWSCLKAVSVPTFVTGDLRGSTATSALVYTYHHNHTWVLWSGHLCSKVTIPHWLCFSFCVQHTALITPCSPHEALHFVHLCGVSECYLQDTCMCNCDQDHRFLSKALQQRSSF